MRPRKQNRNLPTRMYLKHGRYWYVHKGVWHKMSTDYSEALKEYAQRTAGTATGTASGMVGLIDRFLLDIGSQKTAATQKEYKRLGERLKTIFAEFEPSHVKPHHIAQVIDDEAKTAPTQANRLRQLLSVVFTYAVRRGLVDVNPCRDVKGISVKKRDRYITDDEFTAVKVAAGDTIGCIMDFCYLTAQRISDVLKVRLSDITADGVYFEQGKTGKKLLVAMSPDLADVIERARGLHTKTVRGLTLFYGRGGKQYGYFGISAMFRRACKQAGVDDFHIHDIRAKSLTDASRQGLDAQRLAGHKTAAMTAHYVKARDVEVAKSPRMGKVLDSKRKY